MRQLIEQIQMDTEPVNEVSWRQVAGGAAIAGALMTGTPDVAHAMSHRHHHVHQLPHRSYSESDYVSAIVGEASHRWDWGTHTWVPNEYQNILAIACAIRNRMKDPYYKNNVLYGVEGLGAKHNAGESPETYEKCKKAWEESAHKDIVNGADVWGSPADIKKFRRHAWFKNMVPVAEFGGHTFFKKKPKE